MTTMREALKAARNFIVEEYCDPTHSDWNFPEAKRVHDTICAALSAPADSQIDKYGVVLMMIQEGCVDPVGLARGILQAHPPADSKPKIPIRRVERKPFDYSELIAEQNADSLDAAIENWPKGTWLEELSGPKHHEWFCVLRNFGVRLSGTGPSPLAALRAAIDKLQVKP